MPIITCFQFFKAILSFCLSNSYLCNPPASPPYRGCLESVIHVYIYHLLHHQCLDYGGPVLLPPIVRIMSASHLQAVLRVSISINNVNYFHLISPYWHQSYSCMRVWYMMTRWWCLRCCVQVSLHSISLRFSLIIHSSVPRWHIAIFTHIWLFDEQNNDLQLISVERFLANGRSVRKQISNAIFYLHLKWAFDLLCAFFFITAVSWLIKFVFLCKCKCCPPCLRSGTHKAVPTLLFELCCNTFFLHTHQHSSM